MTNINLNEKEVILLKEEEILNAMKNGDVEKLGQLIHDDLVFNIPNGQITTKMMDIEAYRTGNMEIDKIEAREQVVSLIGDNATVSVIVNMEGKFLKKPFGGSFRVLRVWKELDKEWKIIAGSSIQI